MLQSDVCRDHHAEELSRRPTGSLESLIKRFSNQGVSIGAIRVMHGTAWLPLIDDDGYGIGNIAIIGDEARSIAS
jgi:hypothetical protein